VKQTPVSIAIFNNKGGVGKTTLLCNIAAYLAVRQKKKVLVIDADPQCNSTQNMFSEEAVENIYLKNEFTINNVVGPLSRGKGFSEEIIPKKGAHFGADVLTGDPKLAMAEDLLAKDWSDAISGNTRGIRTTYLFRELIQSKCSNYQYVIFDMGPSLGAINRAVLLACDYFLTPMSTDIFSLRAIENISKSLLNWKKSIERGIEENEEGDEIGIEDLNWRLRYLGFVTQQYTSKKDFRGERRPVKAYDKIMRRVPEVIQREIVAKLQPKLRGEYELGTIPTLHSLIPLSQNCRKPIFLLKSEDGVVGAHFAKVKEYEQILIGIVDKLNKNIKAFAR
jgi:cellulose biosynthesis protein BcsQ